MSKQTTANEIMFKLAEEGEFVLYVESLVAMRRYVKLQYDKESNNVDCIVEFKSGDKVISSKSFNNDGIDAERDVFKCSTVNSVMNLRSQLADSYEYIYYVATRRSNISAHEKRVAPIGELHGEQVGEIDAFLRYIKKYIAAGFKTKYRYKEELGVTDAVLREINLLLRTLNKDDVIPIYNELVSNRKEVLLRLVQVEYLNIDIVLSFNGVECNDLRWEKDYADYLSVLNGLDQYTLKCMWVAMRNTFSYDLINAAIRKFTRNTNTINSVLKAYQETYCHDYTENCDFSIKPILIIYTLSGLAVLLNKHQDRPAL